MKKLVVGAVLIISIYACNSDPKVNRESSQNIETLPSVPLKELKPTHPFVGFWMWNDATDEDVFSIKITAENDSLEGSYCVVRQGGEKIDCGEMEELAFKIPIPPTSEIETDFKAYRDNSKGRMKLVIKDSVMTFNLISAPTDWIAPKSASLQKSIEQAE